MWIDLSYTKPFTTLGNIAYITTMRWIAVYIMNIHWNVLIRYLEF